MASSASAGRAGAETSDVEDNNGRFLEEDTNPLSRPTDATHLRPHRTASPLLPLPEIPNANLGFDMDLSGAFGPFKPETEKVQKRASNVLKLTEENEKLKAELKALGDRLEAAERRRDELARKQRRGMDPLLE